MKNILYLAVFITLFLQGCGRNFEKDIIGKWNYEISDKDSDIEGNFKCHDEFFSNKTFTEDCKLWVSVSEEDIKLEVEANMLLTAEWNVNDKVLNLKTVDYKVENVKMRLNDEEVYDKRLIMRFSKGIFSDYFNGKTSTRTTTSFDGKKWSFTNEADEEKKIFTATKQ